MVNGSKLDHHVSETATFALEEVQLLMFPEVLPQSYIYP